MLHDFAIATITSGSYENALILRLEGYYNIYKDQISEIHKKKLIESAYKSSNKTERRVYLNSLIKKFKVFDDSVQNLLSYFIRYPIEESRWSFELDLRYLNENFPIFTEQTHSILFYEMRKRGKNIEELILLLNLYIEREYSVEIKDYLIFLTVNSTEERVRELAKTILNNGHTLDE